MYSIKKRKAITRIIVVFPILIVAMIAVQHIFVYLAIEIQTMKSFLNPKIIACHYLTDQNNILPIAEDIVPPPDSIFFHETSCIGGLNSRQACSIESAARLHPHRNVYVFFNSPISEADLKTGCLSILVNYKNVKLARLHYNKYAKDTPLDDLLSSKQNTFSAYPVAHTADMLRFVTLYKYGGVYLDTDMLLVKPLDALGKNWAARQDPITVNGMAISLDEVGHNLAKSVLEDINDCFEPCEWSYNGPQALTRSLQNLCNTSNVLRMSATTCRGFEVYGSEIFYPFYYDNATYFLTGSTNLNASQISDGASFGYHLWNLLTIKVEVKMDSPYEILARKYCPLISDHFGVNFNADMASPPPILISTEICQLFRKKKTCLTS